MDFRVGDEVVCVDAQTMNPFWGPPPLVEGQVYVVESLHAGVCPRYGPYIGVYLVGAPRSETGNGWDSVRFRKVQRRNDRLTIEAFMTIPGGFEEPRRPKAPAKKRERV